MKNKWKLSFWICFVTLISISLFSTYTIFEINTTKMVYDESYRSTYLDLDDLIEIINETDLSKAEIQKKLELENLTNSDTIQLQIIDLVFKENRLYKINQRYKN